ncbi:lipase family alpha/beta hydrolase [Gordonia phthalatica]|uniref:GPI inositol-deacylase PGAP1-like alpha/beta domain-containing protein n=1 Tax=Gordonia phthalatica TaxID=1136941 RepID=A0A0N7FUK3_9ACTN|nr:hypothetical protein [Gordonia phthalatica]ALG84599.1 hypothetical protein ACH46_08965 [Gordonia phthalatica]
MEAAEQRRDEVRELVGLALRETSRAAGGIHRTHRGISDRVFRTVGLFTGRAATPVKVVHDAITDGVYSTVQATTTTAATVGEAVADLPLAAPPSQTRFGSEVIAAVTGLIGDDLVKQRSLLAEQGMSLRVDGAPVAPADVADAYPDATGSIAVFVHGLMETEHAFRLGEAPHYGDVVAAQGFTPVYLRYNTGRHISVNGRALSALLERLVERWPVPVDRIVLIGHSMGGLVLRSAADWARRNDHYWVGGVTATVSLGTPHLGAPLETLAHYGSAALARFPETAAFGSLLRRRSAGIRDLRGGSLVDEDWSGRDPDALGAAVAAEVPLLDGVDHYFVSATVTRSPRNPVGRVVGDGLVLYSSARGEQRARRIGFDPSNGLHLGRAHHFTLLHDPAVAEKLAAWLA